MRNNTLEGVTYYFIVGLITCGSRTVSEIFLYSALNNGVTLKFGFSVVQGHGNGTIRKLGYSFLFAFHSNYDSIFVLPDDEKSLTIGYV